MRRLRDVNDGTGSPVPGGFVGWCSMSATILRSSHVDSPARTFGGGHLNRPEAGARGGVLYRPTRRCDRGAMIRLTADGSVVDDQRLLSGPRRHREAAHIPPADPARPHFTGSLTVLGTVEDVRLIHAVQRGKWESTDRFLQIEPRATPPATSG
jgi:hypothetical protein